MARHLLKLSLLAVLSLGFAQAQQLDQVLPEGTAFAIGVQDLETHSDKFDEIIAEAERLELGDVLEGILGDAEDELDDVEEFADEVPESLRDLDPMEVFGTEAWFAVAASSFNPMPSVVFVSRTTGAATSQLTTAIEESAQEEGAQTVSESGFTMYLFPVEEADSPVQAVAVSMANDVLVASSNPEEARGVLRRLAGSGEPGFTASEGYVSTLGELGSGTTYSYFDFSVAAETLRPFAGMLGMEALSTRLLSGLSTIGVSATVLTLTDDGMTSRGMRVPGEEDAEVAELLSGEGGLTREPLEFVSTDALGVSAADVDLPGWWDYLNGIARSVEELGGMDLNQMAEQFVGINLQTALFDWMGSEAATVSSSLGEVVEPGMPSENLLGDAVYLVRATDEAAATQGLATLFGTASAMVASFADPSGQGMAEIEQREVAGAQVTSYQMGPGITIAHAVSDGWALIATSDSAMDGALMAKAEGLNLPDRLSSLANEIPNEASAYSVTDFSLTLSQSGSLYASQLQMFAGLGGGFIDFDELQEAGESIEEFFDFLSQRAGGAVNYTVPEGGGAMYSEGRTEFDW